MDLLDPMYAWQSLIMQDPSNFSSTSSSMLIVFLMDPSDWKSIHVDWLADTILRF